MNYRHIYHAGNICDVVKHTALTLLLKHLRGKESGFFVLDTHAGIGLYDLRDERAAKTGEATAGILKLLEVPPLPELEDYYSILSRLNTLQQPLRYYPGSPLIAHALLRPQDRLVLCELHPEDVETLRHFVPQANIHHRDGYGALKAFLPPPEKRGLVLIDPPFEQPDEFEQLPQILLEAYQRWPQGQFVLWYPIKERPTIWHFHEAMVATGIPKQLCAEFMFEEETRHDRLNGCGLLLINPPWRMDKRLGQLFADLLEALQPPYQRSFIKWWAPQ